MHCPLKAHRQKLSEGVFSGDRMEVSFVEIWARHKVTIYLGECQLYSAMSFS